METTTSLLTKFEAVKIENVDRISSEDKEFCEYHETILRKTVAVYNDFITAVKSLVNEVKVNSYKEESYNLFLSFSTDVGPAEKRIKELKNSFVDRVCRHFASKYKVTIDRDFKEKYDETITFNNILDEIFLQLGGYSFEEKSVNEIKAKMKHAASNYHGDPKFQIKKNKLIMDCIHQARYDDIWKRWTVGKYSYDGELMHFYTALSHFDHNEKSCHWELKQFLDANDEKNPALFTKYEFCTMEKLRSIKFYKNGKIDIEFTTAEQARAFAKDYCGYIERNEAIGA